MAITARAVGAWAYAASGSVTTTLPTHATGDMLLVRVAYKSSAVATCAASTATGGWTKLGEFVGSTNSGNGTGSVNVAVFYKQAASASETNPTITFSQAVTQVGHVGVSYQKDSGETWDTPFAGVVPGTAFAATTSVSTVVAASWSSTNIAGDLFDFWLAAADDTTITVPTVFETGGLLVWAAAATEYPATAGSDTSGADGAYDGGYRIVASGTSTQTRVSATLSTSENGTVWATRLRVTAANQLVTPTTAALVATKFAPTVTASDHQLVTPTTAALTSATFVPVIKEATIPTTAALVATKYAPRVIDSTYSAAVLLDNPTVYWRLGEASGGPWIDIIGGLSATQVGTVDQVTGLVPTDPNKAIGMSTTGEYLTTPDTAALDFTTNFSIELWTYIPTNAGGANVLFAKGTTGQPVIFYNKADNRLRFDNVSGVTVARAEGFTENATHHIVVTFATTSTSGKVYIDGVDATVVGTGTTFAPNAGALTIGSEAGSVTLPAGGVIDELAIYNTVLSAARIAAHYNAGIGPQIVTPTTKALTLATFAPTVTQTDNQLVTPTTKAAVLATFAPTVTASDQQSVTPTTKAVALTTFAATVTATDRQLVTPSTAAVTVQPFAPAVAATDQQAVTPTTKALTLATFAPVVSTPQTVTPSAISLALATFAPTVSAPDPQLVTPTTKSLVLATFAPSVGVSDAASIVPPNASLSLTAYAPTVTVPNPQLVTPTTPALELHGFEPVITASSHQAVVPTTAALVTIRHIPTVAATANQSAIPATKALTLTTYAPRVTVNNIVATVTIGLTLTTFAPSVTAGTNSYAFPGPASLALTGYAPFIDLSAHKLVTPATAVLVITTYPPTAEQHSITPLPTPIYGFAIVATGDTGSVGTAQGGATVTTSEGSSAVSVTGPSAKVTIR